MLTEPDYRPVTHFALAGGDETRSPAPPRRFPSTSLDPRPIAAVIHAEIETAVDCAWLRRSLRRYSDCRLRSTSFDWIHREARLMASMPWELAICSLG